MKAIVVISDHHGGKESWLIRCEIWLENGFYCAEDPYPKHPSFFNPEDAKKMFEGMKIRVEKANQTVIEPKTYGNEYEWIVDL
jgi:hypothetical protein